MSRNTLLQELWRIETRFDEGAWDASCPSDGQGRAFAPLLESVRCARWSESYVRADQAFHASTSAIERAFVLQWAVVASEIQYDLETRASWLVRWKEIEGWAEESYCRYLRMYQDAVTRFFEGSLQEAEARFQKALEIAIGTSYERGQMRCLYHLGLVQRDRSRNDDAAAFFQAALKLARKRKSHAYGVRIEDQLSRLGVSRRTVSLVLDGARVPPLSPAKRKEEIEKRLLAGSFAEARRMIVEAEAARRRAGLKRGRESYFIFLPFFLFSRDRQVAGSRMLNRISDPLLKIHAMKLKARVFGISPSEERELQTLREIHGVASVMVQPADGSNAEVCGIPLSGILDQEIRLLMELLLENERAKKGNLTKETICSRLWKFAYDPTVHDSRIYKLIHKTRKFFGRKDLFLNTYGGYRLNPKFLARASTSVFGILEERRCGTRK